MGPGLMSSPAMTMAEIKRLPATVDAGTTAQVLGVSRSTIYASIADGSFAGRTLTVRGRRRIITQSLIELLDGKAAEH
jgi:hypothetical protein